MARELHSAPAAAAMALIVCVVGVSFMILVLLPGVTFPTYHALAVPAVSRHISNISRAAGMVILFGYLSGVIGWMVMLAFRQDGMHRIASMRSVRKQN